MYKVGLVYTKPTKSENPSFFFQLRPSVHTRQISHPKHKGKKSLETGSN